MTTFGFVHGGCHGAWQWGPLIYELDELKHRSLVIDLPISNPKLGVVDYAASVASAFRSEPDLVLVGHSLGGYVIPFVSELIPIAKLVFLAGAIQEGAFPGLPPASSMLLIPPDAMPVGADGCIRMSADATKAYFYHDLSESMRAWATSQLRPQSALGAVTQRLPRLDPGLSIASIVCTDDRAISPEWAATAARDALHTEPYELPGSHSPFLTRPAALAAVLDDIADTR